MQEETYFCLTNMNRAPLKKGEQAYNCYGNRSNRFLLMDYGFAFPDNKYDSVELYLNMSSEYKQLDIHDMVDFAPTKNLCQIFRLKNDQICDVLVHYLRSVCRERFLSKNKTLLDIMPQHLIMTRPRDIFYEMFVFGYYKNVVDYVKRALDLKSTLEMDIELLKSSDLSWHKRMAIVYRSERKKIVRN